MQAIELKSFVDRCQNSLQLNVSKAELPALELTVKHGHLDSAVVFLKGLVEDTNGKVVLEPTTPEEMLLMADNTDGSLVVRTDCLDDTKGTRRMIRRNQMQVRV